MIRLVIAGIIVYVIYRFSRFLFAPSGKISENHPGGASRIKGEELVKDPCCGTYVPVSSAYKAVLKGKTLYFCSRECLEKYTKENS
ncbi:MAG: YHS domain-containing protein [Thermodesulfobacteriota bacterium]|nr:YHS domain-containing protein [Thermodesulfobacteriota bacterium]